MKDCSLYSFRTFGVSPDKANLRLKELGSSPITQQVKAASLVARPQLSVGDILEMDDQLFHTLGLILPDEKDILEQVEILLKYQGYIEREQDLAEKTKRLEDVLLPDNIDYPSMNSLSLEAKEKLSKLRPRSIGQASRISGVSPSDISVLLIHIGR